MDFLHSLQALELANAIPRARDNEAGALMLLAFYHFDCLQFFVSSCSRLNKMHMHLCDHKPRPRVSVLFCHACSIVDAPLQKI